MQKLLFFITICFSREAALAQHIAVYPAKAKVFYQWIENPLTIVRGSYPCKNIVAIAEKGVIKGEGCDLVYVAPSDTIHAATLRLGVRKNGKITWMFDTSLVVKNLPDPEVNLSGKAGGKIQRNILLLSHSVYVPFFSGFCTTDDKQQVVKSYSLSVFRDNTLLYSEKATDGGKLTNRFKDFVRIKCHAGDKIYFDHIICLLYDKEIRPLKQTLAFTLLD